MTEERHWYEPPAPRDWHPKPADLQRIESATSLRRAILERSDRTSPIKETDRASLQSSSSSKSNLYEFDKNTLEKSFRGSVSSRRGSVKSRAASSKDSLEGSFRRDVKSEGDPSTRILASVASLSRGMTTSAAGGTGVIDLNTTFVIPKKLKDQSDITKILVTTPPARPRSSTMTKYEPLPAISSGHSDTTQHSSNTKTSEFQPPPLVRSKTFDVIDTSLMNLPVVDDAQDDELGFSSEDRLSPPHTVTVNIEGKTLGEYISHARDGLLKSRPGTRYGRPERARSSLYGGDLHPVANLNFTRSESFSLQEEIHSDKMFHPNEDSGGLVQRFSVENDARNKQLSGDNFLDVEGHDDHNIENKEVLHTAEVSLRKDWTDSELKTEEKTEQTKNYTMPNKEGEKGDENSQETKSGDKEFFEPSQSSRLTENNNSDVDRQKPSEHSSRVSNKSCKYDQMSVEGKESENTVKDERSLETENPAPKTESQNSMQRQATLTESSEQEESSTQGESSGSFRTEELEYASLLANATDSDANIDELSEHTSLQGEDDVAADVGNEEEESDEIAVYCKLPDDSLLLLSSPRSRTLAELLQVVSNTRVGGRRLSIDHQGLDEADLNTTLDELGITNNTTLYFLTE